MTVEQLINLVANMRDAQKKYFQTRDKEVLVESKKLEAEVDIIIRKGQEWYRNHPTNS